MDQESLERLVPAFVKNKTLVKLDLSMNEIKDEHSAALLKILNG